LNNFTLQWQLSNIFIIYRTVHTTHAQCANIPLILSCFVHLWRKDNLSSIVEEHWRNGKLKFHFASCLYPNPRLKEGRIRVAPNNRICASPSLGGRILIPVVFVFVMASSERHGTRHCSLPDRLLALLCPSSLVPYRIL
jgi:hypothetical protein